MNQFAKTTTVPVGKTQQEIEKTLVKYGATGFLFGRGPGQALVMFEMKQRRIKFVLPTPKGGSAKEEQLERTRWRCLLLAIKAKLESTASGITTFEQEFLAHIVLPDGDTVSNKLAPQIAESYATGRMPPLLGPPLSQ